MFLKTAGTAIIEYINLKTCLGDTFDILPQMVNFNIYEDMFFPCLMGDIYIEDSINLLDRFSISGNETIEIKFYSFDYSLDNRKCDFLHRTYDVLKITDVEMINDYTKRYRLHFASQEYKKNETIKISKAYQYSTISDVVESLLTGDYESDIEDPTGLGFPTDTLAEEITRSPFLNSNEIQCQYERVDEENSTELFIEKTKYIEPYITLPYMKPFEAIRWLCNRAIRLSGGRYGDNNSGQSSNFVFFENKRGFQFVSVDTLMENTDTIETEFVFGNAAQNDPSEVRTVARENIEELKIVDSFDVLENIRSGMYSSKLLTYDVMTGQLSETNYDYAKEFYNTESLSRNDERLDYPMVYLDQNNTSNITNKFFSKYMVQTVSPSLYYDNITSGQTQRINDTKEVVNISEYLQKRISQISRLNNFKLLVTISGNSKHKVGDVVKVTLKYLPFKESNRETYTKLLKYYSGNYLITNIIHTVDRSEYKMYIELTKDSFNEKIGEL